MRGSLQRSPLVESLVVGNVLSADAFAHQRPQFVQMPLIDPAGRGFVFPAQRSRHADHFAHHARRAHHAHGAQRHVRHADISPGHEQIVHVAGIEAPVRHGIGIDMDVLRGRLELPAREAHGIERIGEMQVKVPGRGERGVFVENVLVDVVLFQHVVAQQPARFAFAGDIGHPAQFAVAKFAVVTESVFQETPIRIDHQQTVVADAFEIGDLVEIHAGFPFSTRPSSPSRSSFRRTSGHS